MPHDMLHGMQTVCIACGSGAQHAPGRAQADGGVQGKRRFLPVAISVVFIADLVCGRSDSLPEHICVFHGRIGSTLDLQSAIPTVIPHPEQSCRRGACRSKRQS